MEFEFDCDGFLTERVSQLEQEICASSPDLFARARQINRDCHELLFSADVRNCDGRAMIIALLFMRILDNYQSTIILIGRGIISAGRVSLRALIESTFKIRAISIKEDMYRVFIKEDIAHRRDLIKRIKKNPYDTLKDARDAISDDLVEKIDRDIEELEAKALTAKDWSEHAEMHEWYVTAYALLSNTVHTRVRELEDYISLGEAGKIQEFKYAPSFNEIPEIIVTAAHSILIAASAFDRQFELNFGAKGGEHMKFVEEEFRSLNAA